MEKGKQKKIYTYVQHHVYLYRRCFYSFFYVDSSKYLNIEGNFLCV